MAEKPSELSDPQKTNAEPRRTDISVREEDSMIPGRTYEVAGVDEDVSPEVEEIRENIEATREKMGETIDAIQERLSVANISEQVKDEVSAHISNAYQTAKDTFYDATVVKAGRFMKNIQREVSKLPISGRDIFPMALVGLGVGMFIMNKRRQGDGYGRSRSRSRYYGGAEGVYGEGGRMIDAESAREEFGRGGSTRESSYVPSMLKSAQHKVTDVGERVYDNVSNAASTAYRKVSDAGHVAVEQYEHQLEDNPLAIGIAAAALGAAVGMALPVTRYENELLGDTRNRLMSAAEETTREAINKVEDVAQQVTNTITEGSEGGQTRQASTGSQGPQGRVPNTPPTNF